MADLVLIEWLDSRQPDGAWKHLAGIHAWKPVTCASVGWLIHDDDKTKVLAPNMGDINDADGMQFSGEIVIPACCVLSIKKLTELTSSLTSRAESKRKPLLHAKI